jgi:amidase
MQSVQHVDIWLSPTLAQPPVPLGTFAPAPDDPMQAFWRAFDFTPFTAMFNLTGQPAASVPLHWNAAGLPIGVHIAGHFGAEATLLQLAAQLEQARPWAQRRPLIHCANIS